MKYNPLSPLSVGKKSRGETGFSLVEILVTVAILAVLAAIAIPIFLNQRDKAAQGVLKSDVRTLIPDLETLKPTNGAFGTATSILATAQSGGWKPTSPNRILVSPNCKMTFTSGVPSGWAANDGSYVIYGVRQTAPGNGLWTGTRYYFDGDTSTWLETPGVSNPSFGSPSPTCPALAAVNGY